MIPRRSDLTTAFLRGFAVQGSWNYRTLIGGGIAYALSPLLVRIHAGDPVALRAAMERHASAFNAHPYLSSLAVGALARVEEEGYAPETIERFRTALRGPLGAIGDQAVWAGWRPLCLLASIVAFGLGTDPRIAALGFLLVYNTGHVLLRVWGFRRGWSDGLDVGATLARSPLKRIGGQLVPVNQLLMGLAVVLVLGRLPGGGPNALGWGAVAVAGLGGYFLPSRGGKLAILLIFAAAAGWFA